MHQMFAENKIHTLQLSNHMQARESNPFGGNRIRVYFLLISAHCFLRSSNLDGISCYELFHGDSLSQDRADGL